MGLGGGGTYFVVAGKEAEGGGGGDLVSFSLLLFNEQSDIRLPRDRWFHQTSKPRTVPARRSD